MVMRALLAIVLSSSLALPAVAQANWELAPDGHPLITQGSLADSDVYVCPPDDACAPVNWNGERGDGKTYAPGATTAGTVFELRTVGDSERSRPWQGRVQSTAPPTIAGQLVVTGSAQPVAGTWTGGWGDEISGLDLAACFNADGTNCFSVPQAQGCPAPCETVSPGTAVSSGGLGGLPRVLSGRYLLATETRLPLDRRGWPVPIPAPWGMSQAFDLPAPSTLHVRSTPAGRLPVPERSGVTGRPPGDPTVKLRARALRRAGRLLLGRVTCPATCRVAIRVSGGGRRSSTRSWTGSGVMAITAPVRRGRLSVRVRVDGKLLTSARVRTR